MQFQLTTPVIFIIFNRYETALKVFNEIARAKPPKLLVIADGPRASIVGDGDEVMRVRSILKNIDWECELITNFSDENLGCKDRVSSGLDWAFTIVQEAIILEDDCLPEPTFFRYCQELLEKYRFDSRISQINAINLQSSHSGNDSSYYFSAYHHIWGWATWANRWKDSYDVALSDWPLAVKNNFLNDWFSLKSERKHWKNNFDAVYNGNLNTWDFQWIFANWTRGRLAVMPQCNLASNIGFGPDATLTKEGGAWKDLKTSNIEFPLKHTKFIFKNTRAENIFFKKYLKLGFNKKIQNRLNSLLRKFKKD